MMLIFQISCAIMKAPYICANIAGAFIENSTCRKQSYPKSEGIFMNQTERKAVAAQAVAAHKAAYYQNGEYRGADFWDYAEIFEIIDDAYEITGDALYKTQIEEMYQFILREYKQTWEYNPFNDDIMWLVIALTRAALLTGETKYSELAKVNFDLTWERAWDTETFGGGLFWRVENESKNTCVNCPGAIAACMLGKALSDENYFNKAVMIMDWTSQWMADLSTGKVYDCINLKKEISYWSSTYNQGTFIGASCLLYEHTGDPQYLAWADKVASYTLNEMYHGGVMNNEEGGNDLPGFKGILARWLRLYATRYDHPEYMDWLRKNAESAWHLRNSANLMQTQLGTKTDDHMYDVFVCSAAVSVCVNAI